LRAPRHPYRPSSTDYLVPRQPTSAAEPENELWLVPVTVTRRSHWVPLKRPPFLMKTSLPFNLVVRPRRVWKQLSAEMEVESPVPMVSIVRSGDLANPAQLANFRFIIERLIHHSHIGACRFVGVDCAVDSFATSPNRPDFFDASARQ
jgi:hypothetical protein